MCGILGWADSRGLRIDPGRLDRARDALAHRGPDDARSRHDEACYFGFRRLAILDLTDAGAQPMASPDDAHWIVFNGEIYNFVELRQELASAGVRFRGHSDTEVILELYRRHGRECLRRLDGMFALAIYDRRRRTLLLARDRLGEKPLFWWRRDGRLAFASEVAALRPLPDFPRDPAPEVVAEYFRLGFVPGPSCVWPGVHKLPPASSAEFSLETGRLSEPERYWNPPAPGVVTTEPLEESAARIGQLLDESVRLRLRADVPVGCFLSGGLDSSLVAESVARQSGRRVAALTVKFPGAPEDEEPVARETARRLGLPATVVTMESAGMDALPALCAQFDEPLADASMLPTAGVCRAARQAFTVVLGGDGGDEIFGGYDNHVRAVRHGWIHRIPAPVRCGAGLLAAWAPADSRLERWRRRLVQPARWGFGAKLYPFEETSARILRSPVSADAVCARLDAALGPAGESALDDAQRSDLGLYLPDDVLVKTDRMSMRVSLEVRSPFLAHRLVEAGLALPEAHRVSGGRGKVVLRELARQRGLPDAVVSGPKRGFGPPLHAWLFGRAATPALKQAFDAVGRNDPLFVPEGLAALWLRAERNPALAAAVFRVLAYGWWRNGGGPA